MSDLPLLAIALVTYKRTAEALGTIRSTCENLDYPREQIGWYVGDDGSSEEHHEAVLHEIQNAGMRIIGHHNSRFRTDESYNCGVGWNRALGICHQYSDFVLWLEDDWRLEQKLELVPYVKLLQAREDVGIVTFRILSVGADVHTVGYDGQVYLKYLRTTQYAYSGNPLLRHARYTKYYGWFAEDRSPGEIELHQDTRYSYFEVDTGEKIVKVMRPDDDGSPRIWRPTSISQWGGWSHIGTVKTWE